MAYGGKMTGGCGSLRDFMYVRKRRVAGINENIINNGN